MSSSNLTTRLALAVASGLALGLAFPKFDLSALAWVALVPLLYALQDLRPRAVFGVSFVAGLSFFVVSLYWVVIPLNAFADTPMAIAIGPMLLLAAVEALFVAAALTSAEYATARLEVPLVITLPIAWTALEWLRSWFPIGFPWNLLGYAAYRNLTLIQFAEFTGVYGVSALIVLFNAVIFTTLFMPSSRHRLKLASLSGLSALMIAAVIFGLVRIDQLGRRKPLGTLRVAMVQGDIPQSIKWDPKFLPQSFKVYVDQSTAAAHSAHPDLIVWPEAAAAFYFEPTDRYPVPLLGEAAYRIRLLQLARDLHTPLLFGAPAFRIVDRHLESFNRAYLVSNAGQVLDYYDKIELAPFAEYVPARWLFGSLVNKIVVGMGDFVPGTRQTLFEVKGVKLGVLICYEGMFPELARKAVKDGADLLFNITNDAWYGTSSAPYQLLAMTALRSVETHTPLVRVANTGISAVIEPDGSIAARTPLFVRGTETETVPWYGGERTVYVMVGDLFSEICFALTIAGVVAALALGLRRRLRKAPLNGG